LKRSKSKFFYKSAIVIAFAIQLQACSTVSIVNTLENPPMPKVSSNGIRIVYLSSTLSPAAKSGLFGSFHPSFGGSYVGFPDEFNGPTSSLLAAMFNTIGPALQTSSLKVESSIRSEIEVRTGKSMAEFSAESKDWPTLLIAPKSAKKVCQTGGCVVRYQLSLQLFDKSSPTAVWSDELGQSIFGQAPANASPIGYLNFANGTAGYLKEKLAKATEPTEISKK
jgi:hypothetical protein